MSRYGGDTDSGTDTESGGLTGSVRSSNDTPASNRRHKQPPLQRPYGGGHDARSINYAGGGGGGVERVAFSSITSSSHAPPTHRCCCLTLRSAPNRKLHIAFCKALGITLGCLVLIFLLGVIVEPLVMEQDGWMDCVDAECSEVVPKPVTTFMKMQVNTADSLLGSAYHKTDSSEQHAIQNPEFFEEWHERTVLDFLDRAKARSAKISQLIQPSDSDDQSSPTVTNTLYKHGGGSIHTDQSRTREIFDGEKSQLEKAYVNLVPWLPHHMRLGGPASKGPNGEDIPAKTKTTSPLLTRAMLDSTSTFLTEQYPGCMWLRLWVVDSTMYVHSYNTRKVSRHPVKDGTLEASSNPTSVFGSESARLNHFLMMMLHVLSNSLSSRLATDLKFHALPPQPLAAAGEEDHFPDSDAIYMLGDSPCGNLTQVIERYEAYHRNLDTINKAVADAEIAAAAVAAAALTVASVAPLGGQSFISTDESTSVVPARSAEPKSVSSRLSSFVVADEDVSMANAALGKSEVVHGSDPTSLADRMAPPQTSPDPSTDRANPMFHSILSFQNGYGDENTRALLLLPRTIESELSRREKVKGDIRRGVYPSPPSTFAPLFTMRQASASILPPPPAQRENHSASYSMFNHVFGAHQLMEQSPNILLPDFTRWSQLVTMEEENASATSSLVPPSLVRDPEEEDTAIPPVGADGNALPTRQALKLHQLHNKQIAHLRSSRKIMIVLSPLSGDPSTLSKQLQDQADELEIEGLATINVKDMHNMESAASPGETAAAKQLSLQQRMLRKMHILLKHRLVHVHDHAAAAALAVNRTGGVPPPSPADTQKLKLDGEGILQDTMELLERQFASYSPLEEQRDFEQKEGTGFKIYNEESVVPSSCHLPLVIYEETPANGRKDGTVRSAPGGNVEAASGATINPLPGSWAHWLWTCDYLVLREVTTMPRLPTKPTPEHEEKPNKRKSGAKLKKRTRAPEPVVEPPPFILPAANSFDEYWSVTYEPYKHYLPFVLSIDDDAVAAISVTDEEIKAEKLARSIKVAPSHQASHPVLAQLRSSFRNRLFQASLPGAFSTHAHVLHLLPLLHQLFATDWTLQLASHGSHKHAVINAEARKKGLHEEGEAHENAAKARMGHEDSDEEADNPFLSRTFTERSSCSDGFTTLAESLGCLWCVRVTSRHWMRTVMSPEYIASYMRKLLTLYAHALKETPTRTELEADPALVKRLTKIKTQTDVREFIKKTIFSARNTEE